MLTTIYFFIVYFAIAAWLTLPEPSLVAVAPGPVAQAAPIPPQPVVTVPETLPPIRELKRLATGRSIAGYYRMSQRQLFTELQNLGII